MLTVRRFCIGAALGLSLLSSAPAHAIPLPLTNHNFTVTSAGATTANNPKGITGWAGSQRGIVKTGYASFSHSGNFGRVRQLNPGAVKAGLAYTLTGVYSMTGATSRARLLIQLDYSPTTHTPTPFVSIYQSTTIGHGPGSVINAPFHFKFTPAATKSNLFLSFQALSFGAGGHWAVKDLEAAAPEIAPGAGAAPVALALGGLALMSERRRKRVETEQDPTS